MLSRLFSQQVPMHKGRALQLRLDTARIYSLITSSKHAHLPPSKSPPETSEEEAPIAADLGLASLPEFAHQAATIKYHLLVSTHRVLQKTFSSLSSKGTEAHSFVKSFGFDPVIAPSTIETAGRGLFVDGTVQAGSLLAIYPGISYLPSQLRMATRKPPSRSDNDGDVDSDGSDGADDAHLSPISDYAIARYDGVVIDGAAEIALDLQDVLPDGAASDTMLHHPFANAHLVNHPPRGGSANALQFMLDMDMATLTAPMASLIPVRASDVAVSRLAALENSVSRRHVDGASIFCSTAPDCRLLRTIVLLALRDMKDEEIFMDYRFNPKVQPPEWYRACGDGDQASRRWHPRTVFS